MGIVDLIKTKVIITELNKQDPEALAIQAADFLDGVLDSSCGNKRSSDIQKTLIPWTNKFYLAFSKRLMELSQKGLK